MAAAAKESTSKFNDMIEIVKTIEDFSPDKLKQMIEEEKYRSIAKKAIMLRDHFSMGKFLFEANNECESIHSFVVRSKCITFVRYEKEENEDRTNGVVTIWDIDGSRYRYSHRITKRFPGLLHTDSFVAKPFTDDKTIHDMLLQFTARLFEKIKRFQEGVSILYPRITIDDEFEKLLSTIK